MYQNDDRPWYTGCMEFYLPLKAFSINDYFHNNRAHGKRKEAREWEYAINWAMRGLESEFQALRASFDPEVHGLEVTLTFYYSNLKTKAGKLNKKVYDLSNCEKVLLDLLLNPVNHGTPPYKSPNLNIDDTFVVALHSYKAPADKDGIGVKIQLVPQP